MDIKDIILNAKSVEQFRDLMKEEGRELSQEEAESMFSYLVKGEELSENELTAVSGGWGGDYRDYASEGCEATVEIGSDCWGIDGGCEMVNVRYEHAPCNTCPSCGAQAIYRNDGGVNVFYYTCRSCGARFIKWPDKKKWDKIN